MMRDWKWKMFLALGLSALGAGPAFALPGIDGAIVGTEWNLFMIQGFDPNEALIADSYDLKEIRILNDAAGVYALITTHGVPTLVDQNGALLPRASVGVALDYDGNGLFTDAVDRIWFHTALANGTGQTFEVRDGTGSLLLSGTEGTHFKLGSVFEYFIPVGSGGDSVPSTVLGFVNFDNGGDDPDDRLPDSGFFTPIPEPGSALLFGFGIAGAGILRRLRRRK